MLIKARKFKITRESKTDPNKFVFISENVYQPDKGRTNNKRRKKLCTNAEALELGQDWLDEQLRLYTEEHQFIPLDVNGHEIEVNEEDGGIPNGYSLCEAPVAKVLDDLGLPKLIATEVNNRKLPTQWRLASLALAMYRVMQPDSKAVTYAKLQASLFDYSSINKMDVYEVLAFLASIKDRLINGLNEGLAAIKDRDLSVVIYDVTTVYFESFDCDGLREKGMSKDNKFLETQVVLGLLIDNDGIPYAYELFPGNMHEVHTLVPVLQKFIEAHQLVPKQVVVVADAGLNQGRNIKAMMDAGFSFIVGFPINGKCNKIIKDAVLDEEGWRYLNDDTQIKSLNTELSRKIAWDDGTSENLTFDARIIVSFSESRRQHDLDTLDKQIEKTMARIEHGGQSQMTRDLVKIEVEEHPEPQEEGPLSITSKAKSKIKFELNTAKIATRRQWAGFCGLVTNIDETRMSTLQIVKQQESKWQVEDNFRQLKSDLQARPVYVRKPEHIEGHILVCYIALFASRVLLWKCKQAGYNYSLKMIQHAFNSLNIGNSTINPSCLELRGSAEMIGQNKDVKSSVVANNVMQVLGLGKLRPSYNETGLFRQFSYRWLKPKTS